MELSNCVAEALTARVLDVIQIKAEVTGCSFRVFEFEKFPCCYGKGTTGRQVSHAWHKFKLGKPAFQVKWREMTRRHQCFLS